MRKILDGGGSQIVWPARTRDEAQAFLDRLEPIPPGHFLIDRPLVLEANRLESGHRWASAGTVLIGTAAVECVVRVVGLAGDEPELVP